MDTFSDLLALLNELTRTGVIANYAIGGSIAFTFWSEPVATQDLDVVVRMPGSGHSLDPLRPLIEALQNRGIQFEGGHALIAGVPVQFLIAWNSLVEEAVAQAPEVSYDPPDPSAPMLRLIAPTYLVAMWTFDPAADTPRRRERAAMLREAGLVDEALLIDLRARHMS